MLKQANKLFFNSLRFSPKVSSSDDDLPPLYGLVELCPSRLDDRLTIHSSCAPTSLNFILIQIKVNIIYYVS